MWTEIPSAGAGHAVRRRLGSGVSRHARCAVGDDDGVPIKTGISGEGWHEWPILDVRPAVLASVSRIGWPRQLPPQPLTAAGRNAPGLRRQTEKFRQDAIVTQIRYGIIKSPAMASIG